MKVYRDPHGTHWIISGTGLLRYVPPPWHVRLRAWFRRLLGLIKPWLNQKSKNSLKTRPKNT